jgi:hypothetical protein
MRRTLLTADVIDELRTRPNVSRVRPLAIDRFKVTLGEHELDGALSFGVQPDSKLWQQRVILGQPFDAQPRGVWIHEYLLYRWGYRSDAEQQAVVGQTVTLSRPREAGGVAAMLAAARANGVDLPISDDQATALYAAFAGRQGQAQGQNQDGDAQRELQLELPIAGVIRERVEADGFEVWEDSFSMQADLFLPQALSEELFLQVPSNVARGYNAAAVEVTGPEHVRPFEKGLREQGFTTVSIDTILERVGQAMATITAMVSGLTVIALIVAVLGIVNTMIMNVSERTREIGILKALGATNGQVRNLFIVESALIGTAGGVVGVILALLASIPGDAFTRRAIKEATEYEFDGSVFHYEPWLIGLAVGCALLLSVLAALGPATRASRVDPTVALRDE